MSINNSVLALALAGLCTTALGDGGHASMTGHDHGADPLLAKVMIDQLETGETSDQLDAQLWLGKDFNKLWLKTEVERQDSAIETTELQALYSRAISPYWDLQMGWRHDQRPEPTRDWGVLGVQGLAPYFFEVEAAVFLGEQGRSAAHIKASYDLLLTQRLILSPELELNAYGQTDTATGAGAGLADSKTGLRLRYEVYRELAPYLGIEWRNDYGDTATLDRQRGETTHGHQWVLGLRAWF